ncbi:RING finger protein 32 [Rhincodon typus]|uniref:RING finger protein 32 n=1 Tax=Rhincodon typus TaxID=259920 RepID=UPI00203024C7|nr:RING finger protein 32 [Rhincodon typus]
MELNASFSKSLTTPLVPGTSTKIQKHKHISTKPDTTVLVAVALQDHIIRNLRLQNLSLSDGFKTKPRAKVGCYRPIDRSTVKPVVDTGIRRKEEKKKRKEDEEKEYVLDPKPSGLTLAQKLGLVDVPKAPLTDNEWQLVKKRSIQQGDSAQPCAICREEFGMQEQLQEINDRLVRSCKVDIDKLFSEIDQSVATNRRVLQQLERQHVHIISEEEWEQIQLKAILREVFDCPICITPLDHFRSTTCHAAADGRENCGPSGRQTVLLSCSHTFHYTCLKAFEDFSEGETHTCPLCRSTYEKKIL